MSTSHAQISVARGWVWGSGLSPPNYIDCNVFEISSHVIATWFGALKPSFTRSWIEVLLKSFVVRCFFEKTKMKAFVGCCTCHAIWWGRKEMLLTVVNLFSTVKNLPFLLYPNRSGIPEMAKFSILFHKIVGVFSRNFLVKSFSFFIKKLN